MNPESVAKVIDKGAAQRGLTACFDALKTKHDAMRLIWDSEMAEKDRRFLLMAARLPTFYSTVPYDQLKADAKGAIKGAMERFTAWAQRVKSCA